MPFFVAVFHMVSIFNLPFSSFLHVHAQNFITFKMSYNLLNFDRKYVS